MSLDLKQIPRPIIALAPMADMTDSAFCRVVRDVQKYSSNLQHPSLLPRGTTGGLSSFNQKTPPNLPLLRGGTETIFFREMVSAEAVVRGNDKTLKMASIHPDERPLVQQIFGSDPSVMAQAAREIEERHAPDGIDINMGCPARKIVGNFNGAALMRDAKLASEIVSAVKTAITVPLSVKMRLGWSDPRECFEFARAIQDAGADLITVHGRTKSQGYSGRADWTTIRELKQTLSIPVLANGDIRTAQLALEALKITGCDGVSIARGALGNPWIFSQINELLAGYAPTSVTLEERVRVVKLHLRYHLEQHGQGAIPTFRKHLSWYFHGIPDTKTLKEQFNFVETQNELDSILSSFGSRGL